MHLVLLLHSKTHTYAPLFKLSLSLLVMIPVPAGIACAIAFVRAKAHDMHTTGVRATLTPADATCFHAWLSVPAGMAAGDFRGQVGLLMDEIVRANLTREIGSYVLCMIHLRTKHDDYAWADAWAPFRTGFGRIPHDYVMQASSFTGRPVFPFTLAAQFPLVAGHPDRHRDAIDHMTFVLMMVHFHADPARSLDLFQRLVLTLVNTYADDSPVCRGAPLTDEVVLALRPLTGTGVHALNRAGWTVMTALHGTAPNECIRVQQRWLWSSAASPLRTSFDMSSMPWSHYIGWSPYEAVFRSAIVAASCTCRESLVAWAATDYDRDPAHGNGCFKIALRECFPLDVNDNETHASLVVAMARGRHARLLPPDLVASVAAFLRTPTARETFKSARVHPFTTDQEFHAQVVRVATREQTHMRLLQAKAAHPERVIALMKDGSGWARIHAIALADVATERRRCAHHSGSQMRAYRAGAHLRAYLCFLLHGTLDLRRRKACDEEEEEEGVSKRQCTRA